MAKELSEWAEDGSSTPGEELALFVHELRNPLAVIKGYASALEAMDPASDSNMIAASAAAIQRAVGSVESILSSLSAERFPFYRDAELAEEEILISALVEETVADLQGIIEGRTFSVSIEDDALVLVDRMKIRQVLMNLISNAKKFSPERSGIQLVVSRSDDDVQVCVIDEGPGIPEDRVDELFMKFSRLGSSEEGTGLGLHISREIALAHGGDLLLMEAGKGCRFSLVLPVHEGRG